MRTGVLSNSKIIRLLNEQFVNVFILLGDLPEFQSGTKGESVSRLASTISTTLEEAVAQHKIGRSVNTFILSPELELISHLPYRKPGESRIDVKKYETFLKDALAALKKEKHPGKGSSRHVALNVLNIQRTSAENVMNAFVEAFKNLDSETIRPMLIGNARETFDSDFEEMPEDMRPQIRQMLRQMEIVSSEYVGDEFHFRLRVPTAQPPEVPVKMRKVEGVWFIYDNE